MYASSFEKLNIVLLKTNDKCYAEAKAVKIWLSVFGTLRRML